MKLEQARCQSFNGNSNPRRLTKLCGNPLKLDSGCMRIPVYYQGPLRISGQEMDLVQSGVIQCTTNLAQLPLGFLPGGFGHPGL